MKEINPKDFTERGWEEDPMLPPGFFYPTKKTTPHLHLGTKLDTDQKPVMQYLGYKNPLGQNQTIFLNGIWDQSVVDSILDEKIKAQANFAKTYSTNDVTEITASGKVTTITYKPKNIDLAAGQPYSLILKNQSDRDWFFYVYQTLPKQTPSMLSLAWFVSPYSIAPNDEIEFQWFIDYNFVWGDTGELKPGITYKARGPRDANPDTLNSTTFGFNTGGSPTLTDAILDASNKGTLVINDLPNIPDKKFSVGIGMSGQGTFVEQAGPNLQHFFTPNPVYWVGAATERKVGDILDIKTITKTAPVKFPVGVYEVTKTLNSSYTWQ